MSQTDRRRRALTLAAAAAAVAGAAAHRAEAAPPRLRVAESIDVSSGDYGAAQPTTVTSATTSVRLAFDAWAVRASLPYLRVDGPSSRAAIEADPRPVAAGDRPRETQAGVGDLTLSATRSFTLIPGRTSSYLDLTGRAKLPTGSQARGLGSGTLDGGLRGELGLAAPRAGLYLSGGRRFLGDRADLRRRDGWQAGGGAWWNITSEVSAGGYYDWRMASVAGVAAPREVGAYVGWRLSPAWRADVTLSRGLSDSSPDYGIGLSIAWRPIPGRTGRLRTP